MKGRWIRFAIMGLLVTLLGAAVWAPASASDGWQLTWDAAEHPSPTDYDSDRPDVAVAGAQTVEVVWEGWQGDDFNVWGATRPLPAGAWSAPANISKVTLGEAYPEMARVAVGTDDMAHVVWETWQATIYYASKPAGGTWSVPQQISVDGPVMSNVVIGVSPLNQARFAAWEQGIEPTDIFTSQTEIQFTTSASGAPGEWEEPISVSGLTRNALAPDIVVDSTGAVHLVWAAELHSDVPQIFYRRRSPEGVWGAIRQVASRPGACETPAIALDPLFRLAAVAWAEEQDDANREIYFASQFSDSNWSVPANVSRTPDLSRSPDTLVMSDGRILVTWVEVTTADEHSEAHGLYYAFRERFGEEWSPATAIEQPAAGRSIAPPRWALDSADGVHLVWATWEEGQTVRTWYRHGRGVSGPVLSKVSYLPLIMRRR
jgi:hypothetical protein